MCAEGREFIYQWAFANATQKLTVNCQTTLVLQWGNSNSTTRHNVEQISAGELGWRVTSRQATVKHPL